jgi:hypothetical protein
MKKMLTGLLVAATIGATLAATATDASAQWGVGGDLGGAGADRALALASPLVWSAVLLWPAQSWPPGQPATWSIRVMHSRCLALGATGRLSPSWTLTDASLATQGGRCKSVRDTLRRLHPSRRLCSAAASYAATQVTI